MWKPNRDAGAQRADAPVRLYALKEMAHLRHGIKARGKGALRHGVFSATFPGKKSDMRREEFLAALEAMQDALGRLNNIAIRKALLATGGEDSRVLGPAINGGEEKKWLKVSERAYASFAKAKAFWKP